MFCILKSKRQSFSEGIENVFLNCSHKKLMKFMWRFKESSRKMSKSCLHFPLCILEQMLRKAGVIVGILVSETCKVCWMKPSLNSDVWNLWEKRISYHSIGSIPLYLLSPCYQSLTWLKLFVLVLTSPVLVLLLLSLLDIELRRRPHPASLLPGFLLIDLPHACTSSLDQTRPPLLPQQ